MRILVIGSDVSAKTFAALMKHKRGEKVLIDLIPSRDRTPSHPTFSSSWIRNDAKGRWIALNFFRDILGSRSEIILSKIGVKSVLKFAKNKTEFFPSFSFMLRNLFSFAIEPLRKSTDISIRTDMKEFLANRFGSRFARKYTQPISTIFFGTSSPVSPMFVFPRIFQDCIGGKSVLMSPIRNWLKNENRANNIDYLDHDWQRCVSGGQFIRVDVGQVHADLDGYLKYVGVTCVERPERIELKRNGQEVELRTENGSSRVYDLVVTSEDPQTVWEYTTQSGFQSPVVSEYVSPPVVPEYVSSLSGISKLFSTMIFAQSSRPIKNPICWTPNNPIFGTIVHSHLWDVPDAADLQKVSLSVFSNTAVSHDDLIAYIQSSFPHLSEISIGDTCVETIPSDLSSNRLDALYSFHKFFRIPQFGSSVQVVGKFYYTPSGSIYDLVWDTKWLVDRIDSRYMSFPKFIENETSSDWINRDGTSGFSLNGEFSDSSIVCAI